MSMYDSLGSLMRQALTAYRNCDPQLLLQHLEKRDAGTWLLNMAKGAQISLYTTTENEAQRAFLWSETKYDSLFPNYTKSADRETVKKLNYHLRTQGNIVDEALKAANLGDDWNPDNPTPYTE